MMPLNIVVAMDQSRGIGRGGTLPWHLKGDLRHFRELTTTTRHKDRRNVVIMGRKTWDSLPPSSQPLPGRINMVITHNELLELPQGVFKAAGFEQALDLLHKKEVGKTVESVYVIGGTQIYQQAVQHPQCRKIYLTQILHSFDCDTFFPPFTDHFRQESASDRHVEGKIAYFFAEYVRQAPG